MLVIAASVYTVHRRCLLETIKEQCDETDYFNR